MSEAPSVKIHVEISFIDGFRDLHIKSVHVRVRNIILFLHVSLYHIEAVFFSALRSRLQRLKDCRSEEKIHEKQCRSKQEILSGSLQSAQKIQEEYPHRKATSRIFRR